MAQYDYAKMSFYGTSYIGGTAAPDIGGYPGREEERRVVIPAPPAVEEQTAARTRVKNSQALSPVAVIGLLCSAVLLVFMLMARIQFTALSDKAVALEQQLSDLEVEQTRLLIDYESVFNMTEIEDYATSVLGMQRPRDEQIFYLNSSVPDKAVVIEGADDEKGPLDRLLDMLASIGEYFG
ncbi:MAG: cell division protein FtsL [Clostridiales bacterium]|jgi:cell division protein FtsL|nr:cell division protein FtsL [Clostridiales bacterium]